jgi:hypothetical protein
LGLRKAASKNQLSMQPFWKENPLVPTWVDFITSWWNKYPPRLLNLHVKKPIYPLPDCILRKATDTDLLSIPEFWNNFYSQSQKTKCYVPLDRIKEGVKNGWDIWVMVHPKSGLIGSLVRRWVKNVHIRQAYFPKIGAIEYFCVHPAWRKKGVGRRLLWKAQHDTERSIPHFMLWESLQFTVPPIVTGLYWVKECMQGSGNLADTKEGSIAWNMCRKNKDIFSEYSPSVETCVWKTESGYIITSNTYHRTIPEGHLIGILLGQSSEKALDEFIQQCPFGILVSDTQRDGWKADTPFQWISYMLNPGFIPTSIPYLSWT